MKKRSPSASIAKNAAGTITAGTVTIGNALPAALIAGPCVMESASHLRGMAKSLKQIASELGLRFIFKCSYDKANRSSHKSFRGYGLRDGLKMLKDVKEEFDLPLLTDVHEAHEAEKAAQVADILQIPAFLCRQTDLIRACAETGRVVNIKKGQFLSPWEAGNLIEKARSFRNEKICVTERGSSFGYNNLVVDMRGLEIMKRFGVPVIFDATHSVQLPGGQGTASGGQREFVFPLARAAAAIGVAALFMEVHPDPDKALSDGPNSVKLSTLKEMLRKLMAIDDLTKESRI